MSEKLSLGASLLATALLAAAPSPARADSIGFEDLDTGVAVRAPIPGGYHGFLWQDLDYVAHATPPGKQQPSIYAGTVGYVAAVTRTARDGSAMPAAFSRPQLFDFTGACISPAVSWTEDVVVQGLQGGAVKYSQKVSTIGGNLIAFGFDFRGVDQVWFFPATGGGPLVLDELQFGSPDTTAPTITLGPPPAGPLAVPQAWVRGAVTDAGMPVAGLSGTIRNRGADPSVDPSAAATIQFQLDLSGNFEVVVPLVEGENPLLVQVTDKAGNTGSVQLTLVRDLTPPAVAIATPASGAVITSLQLPILVTVSDAHPPGTILVELLDAAGALAGRAEPPLVNGTATASFDAGLDGAYTVNAYATDAAGNPGRASAGFIWDLSGPAIVADVANGALYGPLPGDLLPLNVTVVDAAASTLTGSFAGAVRIPEGGLTVPLLVPLVQGQNAITLQVDDAGGKTSTLSFVVRYDTLPPVATFLSPAPGTFVRGGAIDVALSASDDSGVASVSFAVDGGPAVPASGSGPYLATVDLAGLPDGDHLVVASAVDGAGNGGTTSLRVVVDATPPIVQLAGPAAGSFVRGTVTVVAAALDATSGVASVELRANGGVLASCTGAAPCSAILDTAQLPDGPFEVTAVALDRAGNESALARLPLVADNSVPARFLVSPAAGAIVSGAFQVSVAIPDPDLAWVECAVDGVTLGGTADATASWTVDSRGGLDGPLAISCTATDRAGNAGSDGVSVTARNWTLTFSRSLLRLGNCGSARISLVVEGTNVKLLAPLAAAGQLSLSVPGGSPVPQDLRGGAPAVGDADRDGIPDLALDFQRDALIASISGAIAAGQLAPDGPVPVSLVTADGRVLGTAQLSIDGGMKIDLAQAVRMFLARLHPVHPPHRLR